MIRLQHLFSLLLVAVFFLSLHATVYTPSTVPHPRRMDATAFVSNPDAILSVSETAAIQRVAQQLNQVTGVELVTVVLSDIGDADAFEFSIELFNRWGIGDREKKNGVLVFFALQSRDIRIITDGGMEGLLPDATCSRIVHDVMIPLLSDGQYGAGLLAGNKAIAVRLTDQNALEELLLGYQRPPISESPWMELSILSLLVALITLLYYCFLPRCPRCRQKGIKVRSTVVTKATYDKEGKGVRHYTCKCCGHTWDKTYVIPKVQRPVVYTSSGKNYGGGFGGGFGGGSFGGGSSFGGGAGGKF